MADSKYEPATMRILDEGLEVRWKDGHYTVLPNRYLRGNCGCAHCVDEMSHERVTGVTEVDSDVRVEDSIKVGQYAVQLLFSDLHATGIYTFSMLRHLCPCAECQAQRLVG
jgi:DUF971 family protein